MRKEFPKSVKRFALKRSGGLCEGWGMSVGLLGTTRCNFPFGVAVQYDHVDAIDNQNVSLENCQCLCVTCHAYKTAKIDIPKHAKTKRVFDKHNGIKARNSRPIPGSRNSPFKIRMNGTVERRT